MASKENYGDYMSYLSTKHNSDALQSGLETESVLSRAELQNTEENRNGLKESIDDAINDTANKLHTLAAKVEGSGRAGLNTDPVTDKVDSDLPKGSVRFESNKVHPLINQFRETVSSNALTSLGIAFGIGFVLYRLVRSK